MAYGACAWAGAHTAFFGFAGDSEMRPRTRYVLIAFAKRKTKRGKLYLICIIDLTPPRVRAIWCTRIAPRIYNTTEYEIIVHSS